MEKGKVPPITPQEGTVYGEVVHWLLIVGMTVAIVGLTIYITSVGYVDKASLLDHLWQGYICHAIWEVVGGLNQLPACYSCLGMLPNGDMVAMLGIAIACLAAVFGMWGTVFQLARNRGRLYLIFALIITIVLTLSASELITIG